MTCNPGLKLSCTVHGPRPLPRSASFSPQLLLFTRIKFAPFATKYRRGYVPDASERDLAAHLETALRGILIGERWPKSGVDVVITVLEGEEDSLFEESGKTGGWGMMSILAGCITVASAAIVDAGIDCVDLVTGGVAAIVRQPQLPVQFLLDPCPSNQGEILAACVVGYSQSRDEVTELWSKGNTTTASDGREGMDMDFSSLIDHAVEAAVATRRVLVEAIQESTEAKLKTSDLGSLAG
ncbi:3'-5'-exoribonuclease [Puttea exsequens]|nr:3'-5'-exoribonuclease [Puttea exsequens]